MLDNQLYMMYGMSMSKALDKLVNDAVVKSAHSVNHSHTFTKQQRKLALKSMYQCDDVVIEDHPEYDVE